MHIFFRKPFFDTLTNFQKIFSHAYTLFVIFKIPQKHYKIWEKQAKKSWTKFWRNLEPSFDSKTPNLGPSFDSTAYIYIYIYACCGVIIWAKFGLLRCYYLGQVWFLQNTVCQKHYKIGVSAFFLKKLRAQIWGVIIWAKLAIFRLQSTWPR